ncbi:MAG TPA: hypothetical protein VFZ73_01465 [Gemmatimonadaceae bacterium]
MNADTAITLIDPVKDYAVMTLGVWLEAGRTYTEIMDMVNSTAAADAMWEAAQLANVGHIYAPPAAVKARIRQLLTH